MKLTFTVGGIRRQDHSNERVGFAARQEANGYEVFLEGVSPHSHSSMSLVITEHELDLFPMDGAVAVTVEPKTLASEPTHGETRP